MNAIYLAIALLLSVGGNLYQWRDAAVTSEHTASAAQDVKDKAAIAQANATAAAQQAARDEETAKANRAQAVANAYERGKSDAQAIADRAVSDLRSGSLRLRNQWAGCETSRLAETAAASRQLDAATADRIASAGRIVRAAADADAQIAGLQALVLADRWPVVPPKMVATR